MEQKNRQTPEGSTAYLAMHSTKIARKPKITKLERIKQHLLDGKPITPVGALEMYGSFSLGKVIGVLRQRGYRIRTTIVTYPVTGSRFARYSLIQTDRHDERE